MLEPIKVKKQRVYPQSLIDDTLFMYNLQIEMKELKIVLKVDDDLPTVIESDPVRLQQVINNLMSNATKFADDFSTIEITASYNAEDEVFKFSVTNQGIVITDEEKAHLFKRYKTLQGAQMIGSAGSGLGLYICRSLCQALGGDVKLDNTKVKKGIVELGFNRFTASIHAKQLQED